MEYHPGAAETHHSAYLLPHIRPVAVHRTLVALGLGVSELAAVQPGNGVVKKSSAFLTQSRTAVVLPTPQLNHMPDRLLFPFDSSHMLKLLRKPSCRKHFLRCRKNDLCP